MSYARLQQLIKGVSEDQIQGWEHGDIYPQFDKAIRIANVLHIPFGLLSTGTARHTAPPIPDLRTRTDAELEEPSPEFMDLLNDILLKQEWYRAYALDNEADELGFVGCFQHTRRSKSCRKHYRNAEPE